MHSNEEKMRGQWEGDEHLRSTAGTVEEALARAARHVGGLGAACAPSGVRRLKFLSSAPQPRARRGDYAGDGVCPAMRPRIPLMKRPESSVE